MWKVVLALLLSCSMAQIRSEQQVVQAIRNDSTYAADGYQTIPVDHLDSLHTFIKTIIETTYPHLKDWLLADIKEKYENTTDQTLYLYTYIDTVIGPNNSSDVVNITSIPVISHQNNTLYTIFDGYTAVDTYAVPQQPRSRSPIVGGFTTVNNISNLTTIQLDAREFVLSSVPDLANWTLVGVKTQVVAGQNICFTYEAPDSNNTQDFCVFSQVWNNNYMKLTLPDGSIIEVGGSNKNTDEKDTATPDNSTQEGATPPPQTTTPPQIGNSSSVVGIIPPQNRLLQRQN